MKILWIACSAAALTLAGFGVRADAADDAVVSAAKDATSELPLAQEQVLRKYQRFEEVLLRMSELTAATDPKRASLLRKAVGQSKDKLIATQFDRLVDLLKRDQLAGAVNNQKEVETDLKQLLDLLLSEQRADRLKNERERIKEQIRRLNELINKQQQLEGQTQNGADAKKLAEKQGKLGQQTGKLANDMKDAEAQDKKADEQQNQKNEQKDGQKPDDKKQADGDQNKNGKQDKADGQKPKTDKPSDPSPKDAQKPSGDQQDGPNRPDQKPADSQPQPADRRSQGKPPDGEQKPSERQPAEQSPPSESESAEQRVREAQKAMDDARRKLEEAKGDGAVEDQEQARRKLEEAKAHLEEVLRQLREEEVERSLALLEARFRKMLKMETEVYEGTVRVDRVKPADRTHNDEIEAGRLSRQQRAVLDELTGAETLLHEDGTSVAFPEAVAQLREDMEQVALRLAEAKVDQLTQLTEQDIIAALEEMIAAFQKAQKENEEKKQQQGQQQAGEEQEPPLVDAIAELKMIRALQMRVNKRTENFSKLVDGEEGQAAKAELVDAIEKLGQREQRIYRTTRDLVLGKNQ